MNVSRLLASRLCAALALIAFEPSALAQNTDDARAEARAHFQAGLAAAQQGDITVALSEFERAYAAQPHYTVLYNIGRARAGLGKHVEAIDAFENYLKEAGPRIDAARLQEVRSLLDRSRSQVGSLALSIARPENTRVWLDGKELKAQDLAKPMQLSAGPHTLHHFSERSAPVSEIVEVRPQTTSEVTLTSSVPAPSTRSSALRVQCEVPDVDVTINGRPRGRTPIPEALPLESGQVRVRFFRPGYLPIEKSSTVAENTELTIDCAQRPQAQLSKDIAAGLRLGVQPADAELFVDGQRFSGAPLPAGRHQLSVRRDGFLPRSKTIHLYASRTTDYSIALQLTPSAQARRRAAIEHRRNWAYVLGGVGISLLVASSAIYLWNGQRYDEWQTSTQADVGHAVSVQRYDDLALGLLLGGVGFGAGGGWLYFSEPPGLH